MFNPKIIVVTKIVSMLVHRLRRWPNIETTLVENVDDGATVPGVAILILILFFQSVKISYDKLRKLRWFQS